MKNTYRLHLSIGYYKEKCGLPSMVGDDNYKSDHIALCKSTLEIAIGVLLSEIIDLTIADEPFENAIECELHLDGWLKESSITVNRHNYLILGRTTDALYNYGYREGPLHFTIQNID